MPTATLQKPPIAPSLPVAPSPLERIVGGGKTPTWDIADTAVVLSHNLNPDHTLSYEGKIRVIMGVDLYDDKHCRTLTMTSGDPQGFGITHAEVMFGYAKVICEEDILKEERSLETVGQAYFVKRSILVPRNWGDLIVVSSDYHMPRVEEIFRFILGGEFKIEFVGVESGKGSLELIRGERANLEAFWRTFQGVTPGNDAQIQEAMLTRHGMYMKEENRHLFD